MTTTKEFTPEERERVLLAIDVVGFDFFKHLIEKKGLTPEAAKKVMLTNKEVQRRLAEKIVDLARK